MARYCRRIQAIGGQLGRDLDVRYKTAFVMAQKFREAVSDNQTMELSGKVEIDGEYFGDHVKPADAGRDAIRAKESGARQSPVIVDAAAARFRHYKMLRVKHRVSDSRDGAARTRWSPSFRERPCGPRSTPSHQREAPPLSHARWPGKRTIAVRPTGRTSKQSLGWRIRIARRGMETGNVITFP